MTLATLPALPPTLDAPGRAAAVAALCERYGVRWLALFGSAATSGFDPGRSDVDLLLEFVPDPPQPGLSGYFGLRDELAALFGRGVDLVAPQALENPYFRRAALDTLLPLYGPVPAL